MTPREQEEYRALRDTIRERGTARVWIFIAGLVAWAGLVIATAALAALPIATLLPLLVLAAIFEAVFALHTGVERIGRYLQVFAEGADGAGWEHAAMAYGRAHRGGGDPLFAMIFIAAAVLNFVPVMVAEPVALEVGVVGALHLLFVVRVFLARRDAGRQRAVDLERFQALKNNLA
jgi:hypothetical protein